MSNINLERVNPIENLKIEIDLPAEHLETIRAAVEKIDILTERASKCNPVALYAYAKEVFRAHAQGQIDLANAIGISALVGHSDLQRREISERLVAAIKTEEAAAQSSAVPSVIAAFTLKAEELRKRTAAIETREQEDAEVCGLPYEASETCKRMRATFLHQLERLREIRDKGLLPSKAELRDLLR